MGLVACIGLITTLVVSFTVLAAVMQLMHDRRVRKAGHQPPSDSSAPGGPGSEHKAA
jgi:predicted RND superfamily exporter protein